MRSSAVDAQWSKIISKDESLFHEKIEKKNKYKFTALKYEN